jgi:hypothetical protein
MENVRYIMVLWPESQQFMEHPRFNECYLVQALEGQEYFDSAYFIPEDIYLESNEELDKLHGHKSA